MATTFYCSECDIYFTTNAKCDSKVRCVKCGQRITLMTKKLKDRLDGNTE